jgi:hypothetical protein
MFLGRDFETSREIYRGSPDSDRAEQDVVWCNRCWAALGSGWNDGA